MYYLNKYSLTVCARLLTFMCLLIGSITVASAQYTIGSPSSATGTIQDNDPCPCDPSCSPLPTAMGTYVASTSTTDANDYTHFCDGTGNLLLSIKIPTGGNIPVSAVSLNISTPLVDFQNQYCGGSIFACPVSNTLGSPVLNKQWSVDNSALSGVSGLVNVVHYFTTQEFNDLQTSANNNNASMLSNSTDLRLYKVNDFSNALSAFPAFNTLNHFTTVVIRSAASPSTVTWSAYNYTGATSGFGAEFQIFTFSGGGGVSGKIDQ